MLYAIFPGSTQAREAGIPPVITPAIEIGPHPQAATATVITPKLKAKTKPVTLVCQDGLCLRQGSRKTSRVQFGVGLNVGYLASFGPGDRYLYTPTFMFEVLERNPLHKSSFLAPDENYSFSVGIESGYYGSSAEEIRGQDDEVRGEYKVTQELRVVPLNMNVFFDLPLSALLSVSLGAGLGISFASLNSSYDTPFFSNKKYESISDTSFNYQFIGRCQYKTGSIGEAIVEIRDRQASFSSSGSKGDLGGLSLGIGYTIWGD